MKLKDLTVSADPAGSSEQRVVLLMSAHLRPMEQRRLRQMMRSGIPSSFLLLPSAMPASHSSATLD